MENRFLLKVLIFIIFTQITYAQVINVADHGIYPGKDITLELNTLISSLKGKTGITLSFPKGQYDFYPENAVEVYRAVTNHDNSLKRLAFPLFNFNDITIEGNGSTFMFHGKIVPFTVEKSSTVNLKNFKIDWDTPFHDELTVIERDPETNKFVAEIDLEKYSYTLKNGNLLFNHYNWQDIISQNIAFNPNTKAPIWNTKKYQLRITPKSKITSISKNKISFQNATKSPPPIGTVIVNYGYGGGSNRFVPAIHLSNSKNIYIENVTIYAAGGMGVIAERSENIHLNHFVVTSANGRVAATRADATHFLGCKGMVILENSRLEHMLDDGINVHGAYVKVEKYMGNNEFLCEISHFQQAGFLFAEAGDKINIISRETILPLFETSVKRVKVLNDRRMLITLSETPKEMPKGLLSLENITWYPDVVMKKNIITDNRARSALISTKGKVLIEDNYFSSQMHGILIEGDNKKWYESGGVKDISIINNTFENIGYEKGESYPLYVSPLLLPKQRLGKNKYHSNINFSNNILKSFNGHLVHARSVKGLTIAGNTIKISKKYPIGSKKSAIELDYCEDVKIEGNKFSGFNWNISIDAVNTTNIKYKKNKGIQK